MKFKNDIEVQAGLKDSSGSDGTLGQVLSSTVSGVSWTSLSGFVPYTGATANVDLGTHTLLAKNLIINHPSGSGVAASITKGGNGEALTVLKTSGSGNAASILGGVTLLDELHLNTDLADAYISSAPAWNAKIGGSGTVNRVPRFTGTSTIADGSMIDNGTFVLVGGPTNTGNITFQVNGNARIANELWLGSTINKGAYVYTLPNNSGTFALLSDLNGFVTLNTAQTITGVKTFTSNLLLNAAPITGRESLMVGSVSDNLVDKFILANGTTTSSRFIPTFVGYTEGDYQSLLFRGLSSASYDLSSTPPYIQFLAANTNNSTDPNNGVLSTPSSRDLFSWSTTGGTDYMKIAAGGNVLIGISTNSGDKLQINGNVLANGYKVPSGTNAQILAANGSVITAGTGISISGGTISSTVVGGVTSFNTRTGAVTLTSTDVNTALGYTAADDSQVVKLTGNQTIAGVKTFNSINTLELGSYFKHIVSPLFSTGYTTLAGISTGLLFGIDSSKIAKLAINNLTQEREYLLPNKDGSIALTSDLHNPVTISISNGLSINTNQQLSLGLANSSVNGALSSTDWNTFNNKQNQLNGNGFVRMSGTTPSYITGNQDQYVKADGSLSTAMNSRVEVNFTATSGQTTFTTPYEVGQIDVYYNGSKLNPSEFTATNGTTVVLAQAATLNAQISIVKYVSALSTTAIRNETTFAATSGQTTFSVNYTVGQLDVFYNGSKLNVSEFTATNGTSVVLGFSCQAGESVVFVSYVNQVSGASGTANRVAKFTGAATLGDSLITDSGANIGINTSTPINDSGQTSLTINNVGGSRLDLTINNLKRGLIAAIDTQFLVLSQSSIPLILGTNDTERMRITPGGNVGIGTASPSGGIGTTSSGTLLDIYDGTAIGNNGGALVLSALGNNSRKLNLGQIRAILTDGTVNAEKGDMSFSTMSASTLSERVRIASSGNVLIGTTVDAGYKLDVNGTIRLNGNLNYNSENAIYPRTTTVTDWYLCKHNGTLDRIENAVGTNGPFTIGNHVGSTYTANIFFRGSGSATFNQSVTATAFLPTSDMRLKNLTDYDYDVKLIKPITYTWKDSDDKRKKIGYSAQEIQEVLPDAVNENDEGMLSVDYNQIFAAKIDMLENIIKELQDEIISLKNK
jgi:hypothetical protein